MNDEASPEPMQASPTTDADNTGPGAGDTPEAVPDAPSGNAVVRYRDQTLLEQRLRRLAGRKAAYRGPIVATTRGWVSRDSRHPVFAARFLDFAVLTDEHLVLCSTGFFSRRPRRQVLREPFTRLVVTPIGGEPIRTLRIAGDFSRPIRFELRGDDESIAFRARVDRADAGRPAAARGAVGHDRPARHRPVAHREGSSRAARGAARRRAGRSRVSSQAQIRRPGERAPSRTGDRGPEVEAE